MPGGYGLVPSYGLVLPRASLILGGVAEVLADRSGVEFVLDPKVFLLSYLGEVEGDRYTKLSITFALFYARREILLRWRGTELPTVSSWLATIHRVLPLYRLTYEGRNCPAKFEKIWSKWIDSSTLSVDGPPVMAPD